MTHNPQKSTKQKTENTQDTDGNLDSQRIKEFDILRSAVIILLMLHHGGLYAFDVFNRSVHFLSPYVGSFLLGSFIFMSGYLSVKSLRETASNNVIKFLISKFSRIYLPYITALVLFITILDLTVSKRDLLVHILGLQMVLPLQADSPILTLWFIGMLLVFFVLFAITQVIIERTEWLAAAFLALFVCTYYLHTRFQIFETRFFYFYPVFAIGTLTARTQLLPKLIQSRKLMPLKIILFAVGVWSFSLFDNQYGETTNLGLIASLTLFMLASIWLSLSLIRFILRNENAYRFFSFVSFASFFVYLFHRPVWQILFSIYTPPSLGWAFLYKHLIGDTIIILLSYALQRGYNYVLAHLPKRG